MTQARRILRRLLRDISHPDHLGVTIVTLLLMWAIVQIAFSVSFLNPMARTLDNFRMTDAFYNIINSTGERDTSGIVTIVDMTRYHDRDSIACFIDRVQALEPAGMGVDIVFEGRGKDPAANERLIETVCSTVSPTIWAYKLTQWDSAEGQFERSYHSFFVEDVDVDNEGFINIQRDVNGGTVRSIAFSRQAEGRKEYSMAAQLAFIATVGDSSVINTMQDCTICYSATDFPVVPADSVEYYAHLIRGRVVLFGATQELQDQHYTPIGKIAGIKVVAFAVQTMVERSMPSEVPEWKIVILTVIFIWFAQLCQQGAARYMCKRPSPIAKYIGDSGVASSVVAVLFMFSLVGFCFWLFLRHNIYFNTAWAIMGIALLDNSRELYALLIRILSQRCRWPMLRRSLYHFHEPS